MKKISLLNKWLTGVLAATALLVMVVGCSTSDGELPHHLVVANSDDNTVSILSSKTMEKVTDDIPLSGKFPWEVTVSPDGSRAYVSCRGTRDAADPGGIAVVDLVNFTEIAMIELSGIDPSQTVIVGKKLYVGFASQRDAMAQDLVSIVDLRPTTPGESGTIPLSSIGGVLALEASSDGKRLYASNWRRYGGLAHAPGGVYEIDLTQDPPVELRLLEAQIESPQDLVIANGILYVLPGGEVYEVYRYDLNADQWLDPLDVAFLSGFLGAQISGDDLWLASGYGSVGRVDLNANPDGYGWDGGDDVSFLVDLPFAFPFRGQSYEQVAMSSNGYVDLSLDFAGGRYSDISPSMTQLVGFAPMNQDMNSSYLVGYQARTYADHAVFQWYTDTWHGSFTPSGVFVFELVLFADGTARFDYRDRSRYDDDFEPYGVGDGEAVLVDMNEQLGPAFHMEHRSFVWNPATPYTVTEVAFQWEEIGINVAPVDGTPHGLALTKEHAVVPLAKFQGNDIPNGRVVFVDRKTMEVSETAVGLGPRAVEVTPPLRLFP